MKNSKLNVAVVAAIAFNNATVVDRNFGTSSNTLEDHLQAVSMSRNITPYAVMPFAFRPVNAVDIASFGADLSVNDLIAVFQPALVDDQRAVAVGGMSIAGWSITQRFTNNAVASAYTVIKRSFANRGILASRYDVLDRELVVTPEGGANSSLEYALISVSPSFSLSHDLISDTFVTTADKQQVFLNVEKFQNVRQATTDVEGYTDVSIIVLKDQVPISQNVTCLPIICTAQAEETLRNMYESLI